ncbi:hypothetical protein HN709_04590 [Candidatus Peregrinibacteria bacterium]|jgi:hypothetical protein|nr:hypothetical protein [Candidatus Peregrinibacteria bacterium]MBT7736942.1 hypothetical protein [Candidatus Peregrinibacteria bacterium]
MPEDLYYQATESGTKVYPDSPDSEEVPLADYRAAEVAAIHEFVSSDSDVLVMGGMGAASKTHILKVLHGAYPYSLYDSQSHIGSRPSFYDHWSDDDYARAIEYIVRNSKKYGDYRDVPIDSPACLMIDECPTLYAAEARDKVAPIVEALLSTYGKIVMVGGGARNTEEEQAALIAETLPSGLSVDTFNFRNKPLNTRQTAELIFIRMNEIGRPVSMDDAIKAASVYIDYFRLARRVWMSVDDVFDRDKYSFLGNLRESQMPDACIRIAKQLQAEVYDSVVLV